MDLDPRQRTLEWHYVISPVQKMIDKKVIQEQSFFCNFFLCLFCLLYHQESKNILNTDYYYYILPAASFRIFSE